MRALISCPDCGARTVIKQKRNVRGITVRYRDCIRCDTKCVTKEINGTETVLYDYKSKPLLEDILKDDISKIARTEVAVATITREMKFAGYTDTDCNRIATYTRTHYDKIKHGLNMIYGGMANIVNIVDPILNDMEQESI